MEKKEIPIFFTIDNGYVPFTSTAIQSIIENSSKEYKYKIIILHQKLSEENMTKLLTLQNENFEIKFKEMEKGLESITDRVENRLRCDYFTLTIYFRLFIPDMFPEYDKGIYIDSDVIVPGDISELYNTELKDNLIGAAIDNSIQFIPQLENYIENAIGIKKHEYINSGVLLMNLKELRNKNFSTEFLELLNKYHFDSIAPDQDYLNSMCHGKILYLDECWDAMPNESKEKLKEPKLIHYNLFQKPWCYDNVQYEEYFWKYAEKSDFYKDIIAYKRNYSNEKKQADKKCLEILLYKGDTIPNTENTFKKRYEAGAKIRL